MALQDIVNVQVNLGQPGVTQPGFGVPLVASQNAAAIFGGDITRTYTDLAGVQADFGSTGPEYLACSKLFGQAKAVPRIRIGKLPTSPVLQSWTITVASAGANRTYTVNVWLDDGTTKTASYSTTSASNAGFATSTTNPVNILPSPAGAGTWEVKIDEGSTQTWTFGGTRGSLAGVSAGLGSHAGTITFRANSDPALDQTITFGGSDTGSVAAMVIAINAAALYFTASSSGGQLLLESNRYGSSSQIAVTAGTSATLTACGLSVGAGTAGTATCTKTAGSGTQPVTIAFMDAATPAEVVAAIVAADDVTGGSLTVNTDGFLQLTTDTAGPSPDGVQVLSAGALTLGFDTTEHNGTTTGGATNDEIVQGLVDAVNALSGLPNITVSVDTSAGVGNYVLKALANATTVWFALEVADPKLLLGAQTQDAPGGGGLATDLTAIANSTTDFYGIITLYNSAAYVSAVAAWTETQTKLYVAATSDTLSATHSYTGGTDILHTLKANGYARTAGFFHPRAAQFADAAEMGFFFPIPVSQDNWIYKTLAGVTSGWANGEQYSATQQTNITDRNAGYYQDIGVSLVAGNGVTASGEYIDVLRGLDWFVALLQTDLINLLIQNNKVPFTNAGIAQVEGVCRADVLTGIAASLIDPGDPPVVPIPTVTVPKKAAVSVANRAARTLPDVVISFVLAGAINKILVTVNVSQ